MQFSIKNIHPAMWANIVNGFDQSSDAHERLSLEEQQTLVGERIIAYCAEVARANAINAARDKAAKETALLADGLIAATKAAIEVSLEMDSTP